MDKNVEESPKFLTRFDQDSTLGRVQFEFGVNISEIDCILTEEVGIVTYDPRRCKFSQNILRFPMSTWRHFLSSKISRKTLQKANIIYRDIM